MSQLFNTNVWLLQECSDKVPTYNRSGVVAGALCCAGCGIQLKRGVCNQSGWFISQWHITSTSSIQPMADPESLFRGAQHFFCVCSNKQWFLIWQPFKLFTTFSPYKLSISVVATSFPVLFRQADLWYSGWAPFLLQDRLCRQPRAWTLRELNCLCKKSHQGSISNVGCV